MEPNFDALEVIVTRFIAGALTVEEAAQEIVGIGFTESFAIGADSPEAFESLEFQPFHDLLDAVLRLQDLQRPV